MRQLISLGRGMHQGGKIYLAMQAAGDWTIEVQEAK